MRIATLLRWYLRVVGGGDWPFLLQERRYLASRLQSGWHVADVGGGDGALANWIAAGARQVVIVDKETTSLPHADTEQYAGALKRALERRRTANVVAVRADATALPFAPDSLDAITTSQLLEHIASEGREVFFKECARVLKRHGILSLSTPNGEYISRRRFWVPMVARRVIPAAWIARLPPLARGPWLVDGVRGWERRVGHYDHGCRLAHLRAASGTEGFDEVDCRFLHTRWTSFWFQVMCTVPLLFLLALPVCRLLYAIESATRPRDGINLMMTFRKRA